MFTFTCEKCGGQFYSKVDPSGWRHTICNKCSGKPYKDLPVEGSAQAPTYQPKPVPTARPSYGQVSNGVAPAQVVKKEFDLDTYIAEMLMVYSALKIACDEQRLTIPEENLCNWTTSIMIQKAKG
jgi:hypothetical protein